MRIRVWGCIGGFAAAAAGVCAAGAADMAAPAYKAPPYQAPVSDWAGFYLGVAGGYGFGATSFPAAGDSVKPRGGVFGGYAGYNWQYGSWITGLEGDFAGADVKAPDVNGTIQKTDELGSFRARLGYTLMPSLLAYGTAGAGFGHTSLQTVGSFVSTFGEADASQIGWVAGAGLEYKVWGNFIARAEYLHYDLAKTTFTFEQGISAPGSERIDIVRGGLGYKF